MKTSVSLLLLFATIFFGGTSLAQVKNKPKNGQITKVARFKPPPVKSYLGQIKDTVSLTADGAAMLVGLPIKVIDDKNVQYPVSTYGFSYKSRGVVDNEQTGKKEVKYTTVADQFYATPLPQVWNENVKRTLKKNDELFFYDIIVKDKQNRVFFAPNILIKVI